MSAVLQPARPALRVWEPEGSVPVGAGRPTITNLFDTVMLPLLEELNREPTTIGDYRTHLSRWQRFWATGGPRQMIDEPTDQISVGSAGSLPRPPSLWPPLAEPPADDLTQADFLAFRRWLKRQPEVGESDRTRNKHLGTLQTIMEQSAKQGEIRAALRIDPLPCNSSAAKLYLDLEQLDELYWACTAATWPTKFRSGEPCDACLFWRSALVGFYNYGFRTQEQIGFERRATPLRWGQVSFEPDTPNPEGRATCPHGWCWYVPKKQRRIKPKSLYLPLNEMYAAHLRALRPPKVAADRPVFDVPQCGKSLYGAWNAILARAKVKPKGDHDAYLLKHLRKTAVTHLNRHRRGIAPLIVGHSARDVVIDAPVVTNECYDNAELAIIEALTTLPQPPSFRSILDRTQKRLFD